MQFWNASRPIEVTELGIIKLPVNPVTIECIIPIEVTELGIVKLPVNPEQATLNALPIEVTESGIVKLPVIQHL